MESSELQTWHFGPNVKARNLGFEERFLLSQFQRFAKRYLKPILGANKMSDRTIVAPLIDLSLLCIAQQQPELTRKKSYVYVRQFVDNYKKGVTNEFLAKDLGLKFKNIRNNRKKAESNL